MTKWHKWGKVKSVLNILNYAGFLHFFVEYNPQGLRVFRNPGDFPHMRKGVKELINSNHVCTDCIIRVIQYMYNRNPVSAYDTINAVNATLGTNIIIQDGIVFNSQKEV